MNRMKCTEYLESQGDDEIIMNIQVHPLDCIHTPDLRVLPLDRLIEHEYNDDQRTPPLAKRLEQEGILKNPPIVTQLDGNNPRFVVLDGANRTTALQSLGYQHVLVQVVDYRQPQVILTTWNHVVCGLEQGIFINALRTVDGVEIKETDLLDAKAALARRVALLYAICTDGRVFAAYTVKSRRGVKERNRLLNAMVDTYKEDAQLHRTTTEDVEEAGDMFSNLAGVVVFPRFEVSEVLALARDEELLPTGLTRHLIQGRALRVNYPLADLKSAENLEEKNARLKEWLRKKLASKEVRFYGEMTFLFDE